MLASFLAAVIASVLFSLWTSYSLCTHRLCELFSFKKGSNSQNHSSSDFHHPMKKLCSVKGEVSLPINTISKTQTKCHFFKKCAPKIAFMLPETRIDPELASFPGRAPTLIIKPIKPILLVGTSSLWVNQVLLRLLMYIHSKPLMLSSFVKIMQSYNLIQNT